MNLKDYLNAFSFLDRKRKSKEIVGNNTLSTIAQSLGIEAKSSNLARAPDWRMAQLEMLQSEAFWLEANDRGLEQNKEVIQVFRDLFSSMPAKAVAPIAGPYTLPTLVVGTEIANATLHVQHAVMEQLIKSSLFPF